MRADNKCSSQEFFSIERTFLDLVVEIYSYCLSVLISNIIILNFSTVIIVNFFILRRFELSKTYILKILGFFNTNNFNGNTVFVH